MRVLYLSKNVFLKIQADDHVSACQRCNYIDVEEVTFAIVLV